MVSFGEAVEKIEAVLLRANELVRVDGVDIGVASVFDEEATVGFVVARASSTLKACCR